MKHLLLYPRVLVWLFAREAAKQIDLWPAGGRNMVCKLLDDVDDGEGDLLLCDRLAVVGG